MLISILNNLDADPRVWSVGLSEDFVGQAFARNKDDDPWTLVSGELAIELRGSVIPEPAATVLALVGLAGLGRRTRAAR